jgi:hypothetical protein
VSDADDLQANGVDLYADLFPALADGRLPDRFAAIEVPADRAIIPILEPGVTPPDQENRPGTQQNRVSNDR